MSAAHHVNDRELEKPSDGKRQTTNGYYTAREGGVQADVCFTPESGHLISMTAMIGVDLWGSIAANC